MSKEIAAEDLARAKRVASLRQLTGLSRRAFADRYGVAPGTLQHWENGLPSISLQGAKRLIKALSSGGIHCGLEWLIYGIGNPPQLPHPLAMGHPHQPRSFLSNDVEIRFIAEELALFQAHYPTSIEMVVADDGMLPAYRPGDVVAGVRHYQADIEKLIGQDCIVFTKASDLLLRQLRKSHIHGYYNLACINPNTTVQKPTLYDVELVSVAPVNWLRRQAS